MLSDAEKQEGSGGQALVAFESLNEGRFFLRRQFRLIDDVAVPKATMVGAYVSQIVK
jgi:hypothetical protein